MIDIATTIQQHLILLDTMSRWLTPAVIGVSTGSYGAVIHLADSASDSVQTGIESMLDNLNVLFVSADTISMDEGDADPIITIASGDAELGYVVLLDGEEYDKGDVSVIAGTATLNLISPVAGIYQIFAYRKTGDYASGSVFITVNEV